MLQGVTIGDGAVVAAGGGVILLLEAVEADKTRLRAA